MRMLSSPATESGARPVPDDSNVSIAALAALDAGTWRELFDCYYPKMYRFAYTRTGDQHAAEEIAAEVFVAAAAGIGRYKPTGAPFAAWLYRIARNKTADHLNKRHPASSMTGIDLPVASWAGNVEAAADIRAALSHLTREQQEVVSLRFFSDCSLEVAAAALGKSVGAVKVLQHRALAALRKRLAAGGYP
jgi:RNA polymerase sigma-70 factor (ECF subfamily)